MPKGLLALLCAAATLAVPAAAAAAPNNNNSPKLREAVSVPEIREHMAAFQAISDANGGNRLAGFAGHDASAEYVAERLRAAGYQPEFQEFNYTYTGPRTPTVLSVVGGPSYAGGFQFSIPVGTSGLTPADNKDVTAPLTAVDLKIPSPGGVNGSTSGCQASDFAGFPTGSIALLQRGTCDFVVKFQNAINAGASAIVIMNEGDTPARSGLAGFNPVTTGNIPILTATTAVGNELRNGVLNGPTGRTVRVKLDLISEQRPTRNVIAQTDSGREDNVIVVGAHLDSVDDGAGVNDNGSGSGTILEIAEQMAKVKPRNAVRFIWFSAEESGLIGSNFYVNSLTPAQRDDIAGMLNFDMLASPNFVRFVYDGNLDSGVPNTPASSPEGSGAIEQIFLDYFAAQGLATAPTAFDGRSDYRAFILNGIPAGGLFTGAEVLKTAAQAAIYGGAAGEQFDPCYHAFCDTLATVDGTPPAIALANPASAASLAGNGLVGLDQMSDAAAHATITLAQSTAMINGERAKGNFNTDEKIAEQAR
jgi:Zn-dependent M28 family amino/carboxypeptidase